MPRAPARRSVGFWLLAMTAVMGVGFAAFVAATRLPMTPLAVGAEPLQKAPELDGGVAWINAAGPIKLADLKGKVVVLDFWTFCCINCIHVLPDLAKLEKKYEK